MKFTSGLHVSFKNYVSAMEAYLSGSVSTFDGWFVNLKTPLYPRLAQGKYWDENWGLSCPDEVVVTYPDGVHTVVRRSDFHTSEFAKDDDPSSKGYVYPKYPYCRLWVKLAVETTLFDGSDSYHGEYFREALVEECGIEIDVGESKKGSTSTCRVQD
ncbi:unnamed protein product [Prunus armeniaca]|uniref:Uncharacterized protein n=1 Tax=Prunus armeniaca TaxID=36596 RepID=A0A6J5UX33_PRUAR|nr:unnamed protein product [Prunus armeniaca]